MNKKSIIAILALLICIGVCYTVRTIYDKKQESIFTSNVKELLSKAVSDKGTCYDSNENKIENYETDLNYYIEFDEDGNITYYLIYNDEYKVESGDLYYKDNKNLMDNISVKKSDSSLKKKQEYMYKNYLKYNLSYEIGVPQNHKMLTEKGYYVEKENNKSIVVICSGEKNTGGYTVEITKVDIDGNTVKITVKETAPSGIVTQVIDYPQTVISFNNSNLVFNVVDEKANEYVSLNKDNTTDNDNGNNNKTITYKIGVPTNHTKIEERGYFTETKDGKYVVVICSGKKTTGGSTIEINEVEVNGKSAKIIVKETNPSPSTNQTQVINYPQTVVSFSSTLTSLEVVDVNGNKFNKVNSTSSSNNNDSDSNKKLTYEIGVPTNHTRIEARGYFTETKDGKYVVVICSGKKTTGGSTIEVNKVEVSSTSAKIIVKETNPSPSTNQTQVINYPQTVVSFSSTPTSLEVVDVNGNKFNKVNSPSSSNNNDSDSNKKLTYEIINDSNYSQSIKGCTFLNNKDGFYYTVSSGEKKTGGYSIEVTSVVTSSSEATINVKETAPSKNDNVTNALTYPSVTIKFNKAPSKITVLDYNGNIICRYGTQDNNSSY